MLRVLHGANGMRTALCEIYNRTGSGKKSLEFCSKIEQIKARAVRARGFPRRCTVQLTWNRYHREFRMSRLQGTDGGGQVAFFEQAMLMPRALSQRLRTMPDRLGIACELLA